MVFRVNIDKWLRGNGATSCLLNGNGEMCCLGFAELQCGAEPKNIRSILRPDEVGTGKQPKRAIGVLVGVRGNNTRFADSAIEINDNDAINDTTRMKQLRALAKKHGHRFVFVRGK